MKTREDKHLDLVQTIAEIECDVQLARFKCPDTTRKLAEYDADLLKPFAKLVLATIRMKEHVEAPLVGVNDVIECPWCKKVWTQEMERSIVDRALLHADTCVWMSWVKALGEAQKEISV